MDLHISFYINDKFPLTVIAKFERDYRSKTLIEWYKSEWLLYSILNKALCTLEADISIKM
jgi:hypothetical protein